MFLTVNVLKHLSSGVRRFILLCIDSVIFCFCIFFALTIRLGGGVDLGSVQERDFWGGIVCLCLIAILCFSFLGVYRESLIYSSGRHEKRVLVALTCYAVIGTLLLVGPFFGGIPRSLAVIHAGISGIFCFAWRGYVRYLITDKFAVGSEVTSSNECAVLFGLSSSSGYLVHHLRNLGVTVVGLVDESGLYAGKMIEGIKVYRSDQIGALFAKFDVKTVFVDLPETPVSSASEISDMLRPFDVTVHAVRGEGGAVNPLSSFSSFKSFTMDELLGRPVIKTASFDRAERLCGKSILISGAGGSIGSEISRQIYGLNPARLILLDHAEFALYSVEEELNLRSILEQNSRSSNMCELVPILGSAGNAALVRRVFSEHKIDVVFHCAAYKHVPLIEKNLIEGVRNNIEATYALASASLDDGVESFVLVSTDKAVRPTNIMGASKRFCELLVQSFNHRQQTKSTKFSAVRFGNVLGSSGSVVPKFLRQIENGGPVTITHRDVTRYFMTISEASQLVINAGMLSRGGEVFVLDMGEPVKIKYLAERLIQLLGKKVAIDGYQGDGIEIQEIGLRPGEKLYEELLISGGFSDTSHPKIKIVDQQMLDPVEISGAYNDLLMACELGEAAVVVNVLSEYVEGFSH